MSENNSIAKHECMVLKMAAVSVLMIDVPGISKVITWSEVVDLMQVTSMPLRSACANLIITGSA